MYVVLLGAMIFSFSLSMHAMDEATGIHMASSETNSISSPDSGVLEVSKSCSLLSLEQQNIEASCLVQKSNLISTTISVRNSIPVSPLEMVIKGLGYYEGDSDIKQDLVAAQLCFKDALARAKESTHADAPKAIAWSALYLGRMSHKGEGDLQQNDDEAYAHWKTALGQDDPEVKSQTMLWISQLYFKYGKQKPALFAKAINALKYVVAHPYDNADLATAHLRLAWHYDDGLGDMQNHSTAEGYYHKAQHQNDHPEVSLMADIGLCDMAYAGTSSAGKNHAVAWYYANKVAEQKKYPALAAAARLRRGILHAEDGHGMQKDMQKAQNDLYVVMNQEDDLAVAATAKQQWSLLGFSV